MTERMSADEFRELFGKPTKKTALVGEPGMKWACTGGHEGWTMRFEHREVDLGRKDKDGKPIFAWCAVCPDCGARISVAEYKRATAKQAEEYERRNR